jgi:hypothetical protein
MGWQGVSSLTTGASLLGKMKILRLRGGQEACPESHSELGRAEARVEQEESRRGRAEGRPATLLHRPLGFLSLALAKVWFK